MQSLTLIKLPARAPAEYRRFMLPTDFRRLIRVARPLTGKRLLHISATATGGGVAELLAADVPLLQGLGLKAEWQVIPPDPELFKITKKIHNLLHGASGGLSESEQSYYEDYNRKLAGSLHLSEYDFVMVHDPQPLPLLTFAEAAGTKVFWRCHIPIAPADPKIWRYLNRFLVPYTAAVFTLPEYIPTDLAVPSVTILPAIDPLSAKNQPLAVNSARALVAALGLDAKVPYVAQISRFDPWKDPIGVIDAFRLARLSVPNLRLVLAGASAADDPQSEQILTEINSYVKPREPITILRDLTDKELAAVQQLAAVVIQKSRREGFGLTVTEAMWKGRPVIGGRVGGITRQIEDGVDGLLVDSVSGCAEALVTLMRDRALRERLGQAARQSVKRQFLLPRMSTDELELFAQFS